MLPLEKAISKLRGDGSRRIRLTFIENGFAGGSSGMWRVEVKDKDKERVRYGWSLKRGVNQMIADIEWDNNKTTRLTNERRKPRTR